MAARPTDRPTTTPGSALALITYMLEAMVADPSAKLAACVNAGYDKGLKPYHNFVMKGTFSVRAVGTRRPTRSGTRRLRCSF